MKKEIDEALKLIELLLEQKRLTVSEAFVLLKAVGCNESDSEHGAPFIPNTPAFPSYPINYPAYPATAPWLTPIYSIFETK